MPLKPLQNENTQSSVDEAALPGINRKKLIYGTAIVWMCIQVTVVIIRLMTLGIEYIHPVTPASILITSISLIMLRNGLNERLIASILLINIGSILVIFCIISAGFKGPVIYLLITLPVMAFLLVGHITGWITFFVTISIFILFGYLNFTEYPFKAPAFDGNRIFVARAIAVSFVAFIVSWIGWYYIRIHDEFSSSIHEKNRQLELASKHKTEFIASMSHELRTPLNAIIGFSKRLLKRDSGEDQRTTTALDAIHRSGNHLLSLINDVLDMAKIESGKFELHTDRLNIMSVVQAVSTDMQILAEEKNIVMQLETPENVTDIPVILDPKCIRQIISNLLSNAIKYTTEGTVTLGVTVRDASRTVAISVKDTGCGIPDDAIQGLFEQFTRLKQHDKSNIGGTGLGLVIVKKYVDLQKGTIEVSSVVGEGSEFTVVFAIED